MFRLDQLFNDPESFLFYKFSVMIMSMFVFYSLSYYVLAPRKFKKPDISYVLIVMIIHIIQVVFIKYFYDQEKYYICWAIILVPVLLYIAYSKYTERQEMYEKMRYMQFMQLQQAQQAQNGQQSDSKTETPGNFMVNPSPQFSSAQAPPQTVMQQMYQKPNMPFNTQQQMMQPQMMQQQPQVQQRLSNNIVDMIPQVQAQQSILEPMPLSSSFGGGYDPFDASYETLF